MYVVTKIEETYDQIFVLNQAALAQDIIFIPIQSLITHMCRGYIILVSEALSELRIFIRGTLPLSYYSVMTWTLRFFIAEHSMM